MDKIMHVHIWQRITLIVVMMFTTVPPAAGAEIFAAKASLYNILSIIQTNYITPQDNWTLMTGAVEIIREHPGNKGTRIELDDSQIRLFSSDPSPLVINKENIQENAFQLIESLSAICSVTARENPLLTVQDLVELASRGFISKLDSHSSYISAEEFQAMRAKNDGLFGGIGVEIIIRDGILTVISPFEETPAHKAGIKANDRILAINGEPTASLALQDAVSKIRGISGTQVRLSIGRDGWDAPREFSITRGVTMLHSVKNKVIEPGYFYLKILSFLSVTADDTKRMLDEYGARENIKGVILDLRNNPGGLLEQSIDVADLFLDSGIIVSSLGTTHDQDMQFVAKRQRHRYPYPLVILVNEGSASGTEIVAAAIKDNNRALLVGTRTFGKGTIQTIFPLSGGAALRLTTAEFFTPRGDKIEETGIWPNLMTRGATDEDSGKTEPADSPESQAAARNIPFLPVSADSDEIMIRLAVDLLKCVASSKKYSECVSRTVASWR